MKNLKILIALLLVQKTALADLDPALAEQQHHDKLTSQALGAALAAGLLGSSVAALSGENPPPPLLYQAQQEVKRPKPLEITIEYPKRRILEGIEALEREYPL